LAFASRTRAAACHFGTGNATREHRYASTHPSADFGRPRADFLAQLIATVAQVPQTRMRRRAEPSEAATVYGAIERRPAAHRPALSRWL
jgi:hypothetical protein